MSTTLNEARVILLSRLADAAGAGQDWVPAGVDGWGDISATTDSTGKVVLEWVEYAGQVARQRAKATGLSLDEYTNRIAAIARGD